MKASAFIIKVQILVLADTSHNAGIAGM